MQEFEQWFQANEDILTIQFAESGADRELDFDFEKESYAIYQACCGNNLKHMGNYNNYFNKKGL